MGGLLCFAECTITTAAVRLLLCANCTADFVLVNPHKGDYCPMGLSFSFIEGNEAWIGNPCKSVLDRHREL